MGRPRPPFLSCGMEAKRSLPQAFQFPNDVRRDLRSAPGANRAGYQPVQRLWLPQRQPLQRQRLDLRRSSPSAPNYHPESRTEVEVLGRLVSDPELGGLDRQPSDHCDGVAIQAERLSGGTECRPSNLSALKGEDSQATLRITTLTLTPAASHRPHASGFQTGTNPITAALYVLRLQVQLNHE